MSEWGCRGSWERALLHRVAPRLQPNAALRPPLILLLSLLPLLINKAAAFYVDDSLGEAGAGGVATAVQHNGKEMSYNNYLDADAAYVACCDFQARTV